MSQDADDREDHEDAAAFQNGQEPLDPRRPLGIRFFGPPPRLPFELLTTPSDN